jgi:hypothetical protein
MEVDHIDRNRSNNRLENLRVVSHSENQRNKSSYRGRKVEWIDELPDGVEPLTRTSYGTQLADGYYCRDRDYYVKIHNQYRRLTITHYGQFRFVAVRDANGKQLQVSWTEDE